MKTTNMRRFYLQREEDATGTSGTGKVAEGVEFQCGRVALTWLSHFGCASIYDNIRVVETLHGHEGRTAVVWIDPPGPDVKEVSTLDKILEYKHLRDVIDDKAYCIENNKVYDVSEFEKTGNIHDCGRELELRHKVTGILFGISRFQNESCFS